MIRLSRPSKRQIERFLSAQNAAELTYVDVGATAHDPPEKYVIDRTRRRLGWGQATFEAAVEALRRWKQFDLGWVQLIAADGPLAEGLNVAVVAETYGIWWLNACRVVYVKEETAGDARRFAFAYGTLPQHAGEGEERFAIEMDETGDVYYEVLAFSRPRHLLSRLAYPLMRAHQRKFGRESADAIERALETSTREVVVTT